jgi:hypothetical protein
MASEKAEGEEFMVKFAWAVILGTIAYFGYHINLAIERGWIV